MNKSEELQKVQDDLMAFVDSPLYPYRFENKFLPVVGEGDPNATIMFIGEAPGKKEALTGRPFCGTSGKFLTELIESIGLRREQVYITSVVKDRPPENRDPTPAEIVAYGPFLDRQIDIIQPRALVALGRFSLAYIMNKFELKSEIKPISQIHGKHFDTKAHYGDISIITLYHPAVALYNGSMRSVLKEDFQILRKFV